MANLDPDDEVFAQLGVTDFKNWKSRKLDLNQLKLEGVSLTAFDKEALMRRQPPTYLGTLKFSRVVFVGEAEARLYVELMRGIEWGYGYVLVLKKDRGDWKIVSEEVLWVS